MLSVHITGDTILTQCLHSRSEQAAGDKGTVQTVIPVTCFHVSFHQNSRFQRFQTSTLLRKCPYLWEFTNVKKPRILTLISKVSCNIPRSTYTNFPESLQAGIFPNMPSNYLSTEIPPSAQLG